MAANVRVERSAASLTLVEAYLSRTATSLYPFRSCRSRSRSNALLDGKFPPQPINESLLLVGREPNIHHFSSRRHPYRRTPSRIIAIPRHDTPVQVRNSIAQ